SDRLMPAALTIALGTVEDRSGSRVLQSEAETMAHEPDGQDSAPDPDLFGIVGKVLGGRYRVDRVLGQGGMGVVYAATHTRLHAGCALKFIKLYGVKNRDALLERFVREARIGARLKHPGIVHISELETFDDGTPYIVMELLEGQSFGDRLKDSGPIDWR